MDLRHSDPETPLPRLPKRFKYHVAFSYASAPVDAEYVRAVRAALPEEVKHFEYSTDQAGAVTWGRPLAKELERIYKYEALFCVVFLSKSYVENDWTKFEWDVVRRVAKKKPGYILPVRLDETMVPEIEGLVWKAKTPSPEQLAAAIVEKIKTPPPQPWWFFISTEVKVAAAAALLAAVLFAKPAIDHFLPSRTEVALAAANERAITAHVSNKGPKSSKLVGYRLKFGALPIEDAELRLVKPAAATIPPRSEVNVELTVGELLTKCGSDGLTLNRNEIEALLGQQNITLEVRVAESDDAPGRPSRRLTTFPATRLKPFVRKVPTHVYDC